MSETERRLVLLTELLSQAVEHGLIAQGDASRLRARHVDDSLRAAAAFRSEDALAYDLGSGAGLPGLPLAIVLSRVRFVLAETRRARVAFLELAVERLGLGNVTIHAGRAEELEPGADVATARAFASLQESWSVAAPLLRPGGRLVYFAGASMQDPLEAAAEAAARTSQPARATLVVESPTPLVMMERT